jgi:multicomponent Na+:H+ antiporter subunit E
MLLPGVAAVLLATWASLRLAGPSGLRPSPVALTRLALDLAWQILVAGSDVAWRALHPRLPIRPGVVTVPLRLPPGGARDSFTTLLSLAPGTLPIGADGDGRLAVHCLDVGSDVATQVLGKERHWARALGVGPDHG